MALQVGPIATKSNLAYKSSFFCISPREAAVGGLKDLGHEFFSHGHFKHDMYSFYARKMKQFCYSSFSSQNRNAINSTLGASKKTD